MPINYNTEGIFCFVFIGERYVYKFVCDPDALFQMALAENHRNALKMEAAAVAANNNNTNIPLGAVTGNSTGAQTFGGNGGLANGGGTHVSQHTTLHHHPQQHHPHHNRLHQHHSSIDTTHGPVEDEIGISI